MKIGVFGFALALLCQNAALPAPGDVMITEIMYRTSDANTGGEYLEIHNRGTEPVDVSGWVITDAVDFTFASDTILLPGDYRVIADTAAAALDFYGVAILGEYEGRLGNSGDTLVLRDSNLPRQKIDVVVYNDEAPWPAAADGGGPSLELITTDSDNALAANWGIGRLFTPGAPNSAGLPVNGDIVVTEIMYRPRKMRFMENLDTINGGFWWEDGDDPDGEYVELYNRGSSIVNLLGWSLDGGIAYEFTSSLTLGPAEHVVVSSNATATSDHHDISGVVGNFTGSLNNAGDRISVVNADGLVVNSVRYRDGSPWPLAPDQTGQSLELLDADADNDRPESWRASRVPEPPTPDVTTISLPGVDWQLVEKTGAATTSMPDDSHPFFLFLDGSGAWLIDDLQVTAEGGGPNLLAPGSFESGDAGWLKRGNHSGTTPTSDDTHTGTGAERIVATGSGGSSSNSVIWPDIAGMVTGQRYTISCWVKHITGASLSFRLSGDGLRTTVAGNSALLPSQSELTFRVGAEYSLTRGTPGAPNSVVSDGIPPLVEKFEHLPEKPRSTQEVHIAAALKSDAPIAEVLLEYEIYDPPYNTADETGTLAMRDDGVGDNGFAGDGIYGARIDPQPSQTLVRYRVTATDSMGRSWTWPDAAEPNPNRAYFVNDGEEDTVLPATFLILSQDSVDTLSQIIDTIRDDRFTVRYKESVEATVVIDGVVYDHIQARYRSRRLLAKRSYKFKFNKQEFPFELSSLDTNADWPVSERVGSELFHLIGQTNIAMEPIRLYRNGEFAGVTVLQESPNRAWLRNVGWDDRSEIFKAKSSDGCCSGFDPTFPNCPRGTGDFCAANLGWKQFYESSHLPKMYIKRSDSLGSFQTLEDFILALNQTPGSQIADYIDTHTMAYDWMYKLAVHVLQPHCDYHAKNYYVIRSPENIWDAVFFDFDRFWGCFMFTDSACDAISTDPRCSGSAFNWRTFDNATLRNRFLQVLQDVAENILTEEVVHERLDRWFGDTTDDRRDERSQVSGASVTSDSSVERIKSHFAARRNFILLNWLPAQGMSPPANEHPMIHLDPPMQSSRDEIEIRWTHDDAEGDAATVDLFWTDLGLSHIVPIAGARDLPAGERGQGSFTWNREIPDLTRKPIYVHAVINDSSGPLVGRTTSPTIVTIVIDPVAFRRGDVDASGTLDIADAVKSLEFQFLGGPRFDCPDSLDVDDSGTIDLADPLRSLFVQFLGQATIPPPFETCGLDPTEEFPDLGCNVFAACP
jgi:hypothetical protein